MGKRIGLAMALISLGWLAASLFQSADSVSPPSSANSPSIRRELPLHISGLPQEDAEVGDPNARSPVVEEHDLPQLERRPQVRQDPSR